MNTITALELSNMQLRPPKVLVPGLVTAGLNILAGNPKSGKSFLALGLALALSNGSQALNMYDTNQTGVLYLALEDTRYRLKARVKTLGLPATDMLHFATEIPRLGDGGLDQIDTFLHEHPEVGVVIIDTLAKIVDARTGGNVYDEDSQLGGALHALAHHHDVALIVVHHTRKGAAGDFLHSVSGSAGLTGAADVVMVLTRNRDEREATLQVTGRDVFESKMTLNWLSSKGGWVSTPKPGGFAPDFGKPDRFPAR